MLDSPPGSGETVPGEIAHLIAALEAIPMPVNDRQDVRHRLLRAGFSGQIASWMTTNLDRAEDGRLNWRFSLPAIRDLLASYFATDMWPALAYPTLPTTRRLLRAARSDRFTPADIDRLNVLDGAGTCRTDVLPDAGHWLHVDNSDGLLHWMIRNLDNL